MPLEHAGDVAVPAGKFAKGHRERVVHFLVVHLHHILYQVYAPFVAVHEKLGDHAGRIWPDNSAGTVYIYFHSNSIKVIVLSNYQTKIHILLLRIRCLLISYQDEINKKGGTFNQMAISLLVPIKHIIARHSAC